MSIWHVFFGRPKPSKMVEEVDYPMYPTAGNGDDGGGWRYSEQTNSEGDTTWKWQREVKTAPPKDKQNWVEGSPGVWHRKYPPK